MPRTGRRLRASHRQRRSAGRKRGGTWKDVPWGRAAVRADRSRSPEKRHSEPIPANRPELHVGIQEPWSAPHLERLGKNDIKDGTLARGQRPALSRNVEVERPGFTRVSVMLPTIAPRNILNCIGNTPLVPLTRIVPANGARILLKIESENPTGSMKDRMALAMIEAAESDGRLAAGGSVVEYTAGSTGVSLSLVCGVKGYPLHIVTSDAFAQEKLDHMALLGARLRVLKSDDGRMTEKLTRDMIEAARIITEETGGFWTDQLNNHDQLAAYRVMADEIWAQAVGEIHAFVQSVGTAASLRGTAERLRERTRDVLIVAVEPDESA